MVVSVEDLVIIWHASDGSKGAIDVSVGGDDVGVLCRCSQARYFEIHTRYIKCSCDIHSIRVGARDFDEEGSSLSVTVDC